MHIQNVWKIVVIYRFFITPVASGRRALGFVQLRCKKWRAGQGWGSSKRPRSPRPAQKRTEVLKNHALPYDFIDLSSSADRFLMLEMLVLVRSWPQNHASGSARPSLQAIPSAKKLWLAYCLEDFHSLGLGAWRARIQTCDDQGLVKTPLCLRRASCGGPFPAQIWRPCIINICSAAPNFIVLTQVGIFIWHITLICRFWNHHCSK